MVRVWMTPSELGESGYTVDFEADDWRRLKTGALHLLREDDDDENGIVVGRVEAGRWDSVLTLEDSE